MDYFSTTIRSEMPKPTDRNLTALQTLWSGSEYIEVLRFRAHSVNHNEIDSCRMSYVAAKHVIELALSKKIVSVHHDEQVNEIVLSIKPDIRKLFDTMPFDPKKFFAMIGTFRNLGGVNKIVLEMIVQEVSNKPRMWSDMEAVDHLTAGIHVFQDREWFSGKLITVSGKCFETKNLFETADKVAQDLKQQFLEYLHDHDRLGNHGRAGFKIIETAAAIQRDPEHSEGGYPVMCGIDIPEGHLVWRN